MVPGGEIRQVIKTSPKTATPWVCPYHSSSHLVSANLLTLPVNCSYQFIALGISAHMSRSWVSLSGLDVSKFWCGDVLYSQFSDEYNKSHWFSVCSALSCCKKMEWQLPNSLHVNIETKLPLKYVSNYILKISKTIYSTKW